MSQKCFISIDEWEPLDQPFYHCDNCSDKKCVNRYYFENNNCYYKANNYSCSLPKEFFKVCKYCFKYDVCNCKNRYKNHNLYI